MPVQNTPGITLYRGIADSAALEQIAIQIAAQAPSFAPVMPSYGGVSSPKFRLNMTGAGSWIWFSDPSGYRYVSKHPITGQDLPPIPDMLLLMHEKILAAHGLTWFIPDSLLLNFYQPGDKLGTHRDDTEKDLTYPLVTISIGTDAIFGLGGTEKKSPMHYTTLRSGDILVMHGPARMAYHKVDKVLSSGNYRLAQGGRISFTLRKAM